MKAIRIRFQNEKGETLAGRLDLPVAGKPQAFALFAHCFTCNKNLTAVRNISRALTMKGIAVFRFDFTGLGESEGDFADTNFSSNVADLVTAATFMEQTYQAPQILIGHSLGGAAVILAAHQLAKVKAVATIGAPADPVHVRHHFDENLEEIAEKGLATVRIGGRPFTIKQQFITDLDAPNMQEVIHTLKKALLVMHSPQDTIVGVENAARIYKAAWHPKSFVSLDGADHLLSGKADSQYVGEMIAAWANRYIEMEKEVELNTDRQVVVRTGQQKYMTEVRAGKHFMYADEPKRVGGQDLGPTPYDLLAAALGTCTSITLRMYADRKKWSLEAIKVHVQHERVHCEDCEETEGKPKLIEVMHREIELEGKLTEAQQQRMLSIANRCPVHRTLHSGVVVKTSLKV